MILLLSTPFVFWLNIVSFSDRFLDGKTAWQSIGQLAGIYGLLFFSFTIFLSARFSWMEKRFFPLTTRYNIHRLFGKITLGLLLVHPLALIFSSFGSPLSSLLVLIIPGGNKAITFGIFSLWILILLLILTLLVRPNYGTWKRTHQFLGFAFFLGGLHAFLISSDLASSVFLRLYLLGIAFLAACSFCIFTILKHWSVKKFLYEVVEVEHLSEKIIAVHMRPAKESISYQPGQTIFVSFFLKGAWTEFHPFSLISDPHQEIFSFSVKDLGDDTHRFVQVLKKGISARLEGPFGSFGKELQKMNQAICIAGGIGITPFLSLLMELPKGKRVEVFYSVQSETEFAHLDKLNALAKQNTFLQIHPWDTSQKGFLTAEKILEEGKQVDNFHSLEVFVCGPTSLLLALRKQFIQIGLSKKNIYFEEFML